MAEIERTALDLGLVGLRLDTLLSMTEAIALYLRLGYTLIGSIGRYNDTPDPGTLFFTLKFL